MNDHVQKIHDLARQINRLKADIQEELNELHLQVDDLKLQLDEAYETHHYNGDLPMQLRQELEVAEADLNEARRAIHSHG